MYKWWSQQISVHYTKWQQKRCCSQNITYVKYGWYKVGATSLKIFTYLLKYSVKTINTMLEVSNACTRRVSLKNSWIFRSVVTTMLKFYNGKQNLAFKLTLTTPDFQHTIKWKTFGNSTLQAIIIRLTALSEAQNIKIIIFWWGTNNMYSFVLQKSCRICAVTL